MKWFQIIDIQGVTKKDIVDIARSDYDTMPPGTDKMNLFVQLKKMEVYLKQVMSMAKVDAVSAIREYEDEYEDSPEKGPFKITIGAKITYSNAHYSPWVEAHKELKRIEKGMELAAKSTGNISEYICPDTGECFPPREMIGSTVYPVLKFKEKDNDQNTTD